MCFTAIVTGGPILGMSIYYIASKKTAVHWTEGLCKVGGETHIQRVGETDREIRERKEE